MTNLVEIVTKEVSENPSKRKEWEETLSQCLLWEVQNEKTTGRKNETVWNDLCESLKVVSK
tara:strand:- start:4403 stop:4585 length:183 start_codon:yes stop_codon:yes gene_type:complete